jgi:hypothetical protein
MLHKLIAFVAIGAAISWSAIPTAATAQESSKGTVVVYPVVYNRDSGSKGSREAAVQAVGEALQKAGYTLISDTVAENTWKKMEIAFPLSGKAASLESIVRFGKEIKAQYVVAPAFDFYSRSFWVVLGPRTVSNATVDVVITDVDNGRVAYARQNILGRSDEKADVVKAVADVLVTPLVTVVSGGPKTPQEQRAVRIAVAKAFRDWVSTPQKEAAK